MSSLSFSTMATSRKLSSKDKKKKPKAEELVLSAPTGFKSGIQAKVDMSTGEIKVRLSLVLSLVRYIEQQAR